MPDWKRIPTSPEVFAVIWAKHGDALRVFSSYSNPTGRDGLSDQPQMLTEWGFKDEDFPIVGLRRVWDLGEKEHERINERAEHWLCIGELPSDDY